MKLDLSMVPVYVLVGTRLTGVLVVLPALASLQIPVKIKVFFLLAIVLLLGPVLGSEIRLPDYSPWTLAPLLVIEFLVGFVIGLAFRWAMAGMEIAGELAGLQMGMGVASTLDPSTGNNAMFTQAIFALLYMTVFLALEGHHMALKTLHASYTVVPVGSSLQTDGLLPLLARQSAGVLVVGLRLASCFLIPLLLVTFSMALVSRAFPRANVFILSYACSLLVGLALFASAAPGIRLAVKDGIRSGVVNAHALLTGLAT